MQIESCATLGTKNMREIKFRVRDTENNKIIGYECLFPVDGVANKDYRWAKGINNQDWTDGVINGGYLRREQYTGLKDKNGKEIYEGDILKWHSDEFELDQFYKVFWDEKQACFVTQLHEDKSIVAHFNTGFIEDQQPDKDLEVIGNIYENPEFSAQQEKEER